jgi:hypothetical protein
MNRLLFWLGSIFLISVWAGCGQEYFSTPEKTLQRYVENKSMRTPAEVEKALNCFKKSDKQWWDHHYVEICQAKFGTFHSLCEATKIGESNIWSGVIEPEGPSTAEVESSAIDEEKGVATLVVAGQDIYFIKEGSNWKIDGFFGVDDELKEQHPHLR